MVVLIIIGALGKLSKGMYKWLKEIEMECLLELQQTV